MAFFGKERGTKPGTGAAKDSRTTRSPASLPPTNMRRELLRLALRQSLTRHGIPVHWIGVEALELSGPGTPLHVRLVVQHWDERLLRYAVTFQDDVEERLLAIDPLTRTWIRGFSWQYELPAGVGRPAMPDPVTWATAHPQPIATAPPNAADTGRRAREDLERMLAEQDRLAAARGAQPDFQPTHPTA